MENNCCYRDTVTGEGVGHSGPCHSQKESELDIALEEYLKPKVFCGSDGSHCSGLWNIECDDIRHPDGRRLVQLSKVKSFIGDLLSNREKEIAEEVGKMKKMYREENRTFDGTVNETSEMAEDRVRYNTETVGYNQAITDVLQILKH